MISTNWVIVILVVLLATASILIGGYEKIEPKWLKILEAFGVSLLTAACCLVIFWNVEKKKGVSRSDFQSVGDKLVKVISQSGQSKDFHTIDRNGAFKESFWVELIEDLDISKEKVWIAGNSLREWREEPIYSEPLMSKLEDRIKNGITQRADVGDFGIVLIIKSSDGIKVWNTILNNCIEPSA